MTAPLRFACDCGAVEGVASARGVADGRRYVCHCTDCQAYAHYTDHADDVLDAHGGTQILQIPAIEVTLTKGADNLAALHLTEKPLVRWSCATCRTPMANTVGSPRWSFYSMILSCADEAGRAALPQTPKHVFKSRACSDPGDVEGASLLEMGLPILKWVLSARLSGSWRRHPLFDPETLEPLATPRRLGAEERAALDARARAWCAARG